MSCSRSENVKQSNGIDIYFPGIVIGKKSTNQIAQYKVMVEVSTVFACCYRRQEHSKGLQVIFREYSDIVKIDILTMQRFLDVSRFGGLAGMLTCV